MGWFSQFAKSTLPKSTSPSKHAIQCSRVRTLSEFNTTNGKKHSAEPRIGVSLDRPGENGRRVRTSRKSVDSTFALQSLSSYVVLSRHVIALNSDGGRDTHTNRGQRRFKKENAGFRSVPRSATQDNDSHGKFEPLSESLSEKMKEIL